MCEQLSDVKLSV